MRFFSPAILQPCRAELNTSIVAASHHGLVPGPRRPRRAHVGEVPSIAVRPEARGLKAAVSYFLLEVPKDERREFSSSQKKEHKL